MGNMGTILLTLLAGIILALLATGSLFVISACVVASRADDDMERMMAERAARRER